MLTGGVRKKTDIRVLTNQTEILSTIKKLVQEEIPDAKVYLFGSRVTGKVHEESDWDILAITSTKAERFLKDAIHDKIFLLNGQIYSFIDLKIVSEKDWFESSRYYVLRNSIKDEAVEI